MVAFLPFAAKVFANLPEIIAVISTIVQYLPAVVSLIQAIIAAFGGVTPAPKSHALTEEKST